MSKISGKTKKVFIKLQLLVLGFIETQCMVQTLDSQPAHCASVGCCQGLNRKVLYFIAKYAQNAKFLTVTLQVLYNEINNLSC